MFDEDIFEEELDLSDKPWKSGKKKSKKRGVKNFRSDDWEEMQRARSRYLKEWEEDIRYAEELANEGMHG